MRTRLKNSAPLSNRVAPVAALLALAAMALALAACGGGGSSSGDSGGKLNVVAAENFWGSIAEQIGGDRVAVTNIITSPSADPHDYEPTSDDARAFAGAQVSIVNGIGYDEWAQKLLDASPDDSRTEVVVGDVVGLEAGDNPHQWYSPESVGEMIDAIVDAFEEADPGNDDYFEEGAKRFEEKDLARYNGVIAQIKEEFDGTKVGASESIFEPLAPALGLDLVTPAGFMDGISEGTEPSPSDKTTADKQITDGEIDLWVYNSQNATPDVQRLNEAAEAAGIPIATVTETLTPEGASFEEWMVTELEGIDSALKERATAGG